MSRPITRSRSRAEGTQLLEGVPLLTPNQARRRARELGPIFKRLNKQFFDNAVKGFTIKWSSPMTDSTALTNADKRTISISPRLTRDLAENELEDVILHEMIHAYIMLTVGREEGLDHGAYFKAEMERINLQGGRKVQIGHDEVMDKRHQNLYVCTVQGCNIVIQSSRERVPTIKNPSGYHVCPQPETSQFVQIKWKDFNPNIKEIKRLQKDWGKFKIRKNKQDN